MDLIKLIINLLILLISLVIIIYYGGHHFGCPNASRRVDLWFNSRKKGSRKLASPNFSLRGVLVDSIGPGDLDPRQIDRQNSELNQILSGSLKTSYAHAVSTVLYLAQFRRNFIGYKPSEDLKALIPEAKKLSILRGRDPNI